jgi:phosphohistidine phosphatase
MRTLGLRFDLILTSPLARAMQTARIVAREMKSSRGPRILPALAPGKAAQEILDGIAHSKDLESVLLVGHEPGLSRLTSELICRSASEVSLEFKKGGLCLIDFDDEPLLGAGRLAFLLPPRALRLLS